ncbi:MAG TPA: carbamate kinase [candidate division Zixibacteria bacterium]|nr:carbamate kinase [candidate division Zixibacteria bacterium]
MKRAVVALGGNAISKAGELDTIKNQFANTRASLGGLMELLREGYDIAITHGNGPQVGNAILRVELAADKAPILPLGICVADTEGGMGYMIAQSLKNRLLKEKIDRPVVTVVTQVLVDKDDPSISDPTKFIGQFYSKEETDELVKKRGWKMKKDANRGFRRVVPSPTPLDIIEKESIKKLLDQKVVVIAAGGGGIPVYRMPDGSLEGVDAVIDKDLASAVLAREVGAELLLILTGVDKVAINFGRLDQQFLDKITVKEAQKHLEAGEFPPGSMGPKIKAAINFIQSGGKEVIITSIDRAYPAVLGKAGTHILPG